MKGTGGSLDHSLYFCFCLKIAIMKVTKKERIFRGRTEGEEEGEGAGEEVERKKKGRVRGKRGGIEEGRKAGRKGVGKECQKTNQ